MKQQLKNLILIVILSVVFSGCAKWQSVSGIQTPSLETITIDLKDQKWQALDFKAVDTYFLTKDGLALQEIHIKRVPLNTALAQSKKEIPNDILPHELAELIIENLKLANSMNAYKIISNKPDKVDSQNGVQIISELKDDFNNLIKINSTYFILDKKLYIVTYSAPNQYFYQRDLKNYQNIKKSIKFKI